MKSPYTRLYSGVLFPLQESLKGHTTSEQLKRLECSQWMTRDEIRAMQVRGLRCLLAHAEKNVPYYRRAFREHGFHAQDVDGPESLSELPFLTKADIRADPAALVSSQARKLVRSNTGGSTGEPLVFWLGRERISHDVAAKWRATRWWDVDIGDPEVVLWGSPIELDAQGRLRAFRDWLQRSLLLPAFDMSPDKVRRFISMIRNRRPRMLFGYPSAINHVAAVAEGEGVDLSGIGVRVAFVTGEQLYTEQRQRIERVFACSVANGYGGRDAGFIAHECPEGSLHVMAEDVIVEIIDSKGRVVPEGEPGEIAVTHLASRDFPFIRYRTGDIAAFSTVPCPCGRGLPVFKEIHGRSTDFVVAQDGTVMHGLALIYVLRELADIRAFRIVQERLDLTRVEVVCDGELAETTDASIRDGFRRRLGEGVTVEVERVPEIAPERSGKYRYVVSRVDPEARHEIAV